MKYDGKSRVIGTFETVEEAKLARDAALEVFKANRPSQVDNIDSIVDQAKTDANEAVARKKKVAPEKKAAPKKKTTKKKCL